MTESQPQGQGQGQGRGPGMAGRVTALAASVMDLHVRIALQEIDREKRRLIGGGLFLILGGVLTLLALVALQAALVVWLVQGRGWQLSQALLAVAALDLTMAGASLRLGGLLTKGPYLPQTIEGLNRTSRALLGR
jgi:uncharacterized membrane protein YqjE